MGAIFILLAALTSINAVYVKSADHPLGNAGIDSLELDLVSITEEVFLKFEKDFDPGFIYDSSIVVNGGDSFALVIAGNGKYFDCPRNYRGCYYYEGFLKAINSYVLRQCGDICATYLINRKSGKSTYTMQCFDNGAEVPVISENGKKMLVFSYSVYDVESCIALYDIHEGVPSINERDDVAFKHLGFRISQVVWIDDRTIALKTFQNTEQRERSPGEYEDVQVGVEYWETTLPE